MRYIMMTSVAVLALAAVSAASAQDTEPDAQTRSDGQATLDEIIVTAQRRSESLQRAAVAVSAVSGEALANAGVNEITGLTRMVPSLVVQPSGGNTAFYLRGVGTLPANAFAENAIAYNVGGVYYGRPSAPNGSFYDLERVEVVKGPQGTLYGRNATGGAINVLPNRPRIGDFAAEATAEIGNYSHRRFAGMVNLPLGDTAAVRFAFQDVERDGYMSDGYDDEDATAGRLSLLWRPNETWSVLLAADYFAQGGKGTGGVTVPSDFYPAGPAPSERIGGSDPRSVAALTSRFPGLINSGVVVAPQDDGFLDSQFWGLTATIEADLGVGVLTVIPAYRRSEPDILFWSTGFQGEVRETIDQFSLEARLASSSDGPLQYVAGAFFFDEDVDAENRFFQGNASTTHFFPQQETRSYALFGQATYALAETFRLVAGGRYTTEEKSHETLFRQSTGPLGSATGPFLQLSGSLDVEKFTYKAGVEFDARPASLVYANIATGFKSGGFFTSVGDNTYDPEELTAYTIGAKNRFLNNRLQFNMEVFWWDYKDQQISYNGPIRASGADFYTQANVTTNVGDATIKGFEADIRFQMSENGVFGANIQYLDAIYDSFVYNAFSAQGAAPRVACPWKENESLAVAAPARIYTVDCSGYSAINSPEWSLNLSYDHTFPLAGGFELTAGVRARIEASRYLSIEYLEEQRQDDYMMSDAYMTLDAPSGAWSASAYVNNIEDETVYSTSFPRPILGVVYNGLRPPRTYGVRLTARY
ncbi:TonB-dependent receptor [Brevundimonas sp. SL130]|uniref:TonB-dependent receptor n=1 Tax=Brevundimonas sp. SL130 TaxID=2995143 RepID=UPI00226C6BA3|nr:TonB-dependent receptor [Brevundimonas sp. SL130]WAC59520.1 TonB-dependent receptor [Brevundimonas sp. SL130]